MGPARGPLAVRSGRGHFAPPRGPRRRLAWPPGATWPPYPAWRYREAGFKPLGYRFTRHPRAWPGDAVGLAAQGWGLARSCGEPPQHGQPAHHGHQHPRPAPLHPARPGHGGARCFRWGGALPVEPAGLAVTGKLRGVRRGPGRELVGPLNPGRRSHGLWRPGSMRPAWPGLAGAPGGPVVCAPTPMPARPRPRPPAIVGIEPISSGKRGTFRGGQPYNLPGLALVLGRTNE